MNPIINDFSIRIATVNGTGSQSSNNILFKTLFRMGIPASPKNIFPSNIKGLPTWYQIRLSPKGYQSFKESSEIAVWMNPKTLVQDMECAPEGCAVVFNSDAIPQTVMAKRPDLVLYPVPATALTKDLVEKPKLRPLLTNMIYVGVLTELLKLDVAILEEVVKETFKNKAPLVELNTRVIEAGIQYAKEHFQKKDPYVCEKQTPFQGKIMVEGNTAAALGALFGGCTFLSWYPITPSSSLAESLEDYFKTYSHTADGKTKCVVVQAEDELASAGMVMGAGWAGARAMTTTSGPGISLMSEFVGYGYFAEIPSVFVNVQRVGPSTGLPTRTQQGDLTFCARLGHGDTQHPLLFPANANECFDLMHEAFDLAEQFQTPIFVMTDLDIGMNFWICDDFAYPTHPLNRGKVLSAADFEKGAKFARYKDVDGDGIPYRTLPFTEAEGAAYFTRGSGHDEFANYTESGKAYEQMMTRLSKKFETLKTTLPKPVIQNNTQATYGLIAVGSSDFAVRESVDQLQTEGLSFTYCRPKAYPFNTDIKAYIQSCEKVFVVDQNRDGQLLQLLTLSFPELANKLVSVRYFTGQPLPANAITRDILKHFEKDTSAYMHVPFKPVEVD